MEEENILSLIIGLGAPILMSIGALAAWYLKSRKEELQAIEERALERRIDIYNQILEPFIISLAPHIDDTTRNKAIKTLGTIDYRKAAFSLISYGSDELVINYNEMMQSFLKSESGDVTTKRFAAFLLSIRKDVYNKETKLDWMDMLKFTLKDVDKLMT